MGGSKKPTAASKDKSSGKESKKGKKDKGSESGPKRAEIIVRVNGAQALKIVKNSKVITVQDLARQLGVKISAANTFLKNAISDGTVSVIGGYSGHYLYQDAIVANAAKELLLAAKSSAKSKSKKKSTTVVSDIDTKGGDNDAGDAKSTSNTTTTPADIATSTDNAITTTTQNPTVNS